MLEDHKSISVVPQVEFHGQGIRVNGAEVSGDVLLAWLEHSADRGYVIKFDGVMTAAFVRTDDDAKILSGTAKAFDRFWKGVA